jgi:PEP-CTERM motif
MELRRRNRAARRFGKQEVRMKPDFLFTTAMVVAAMALSSLSAAGATNLVFNGDFEAGRAGFSSDYTYGNVQWGGIYGSYTIGSSPAAAPGAWGDWMSFGDHTNGHGLMLIANGPATAYYQPLDIWSQTVAVVPETSYTFTFWAATLSNDSPAPAQIQADINGVSLGFTLTLPGVGMGGEWVTAGGMWNSGSATAANLALVDIYSAEQWNDFVIDDISFVGEGVQPPPTNVPEPSSWVLMLLGFTGLGLAWRRSSRLSRAVA